MDKWRCKICQHTYDEPDLRPVQNNNGKKEFIKVCPRCKTFFEHSVSLVKVDIEAPVVLMTPSTRIRLDEEKFSRMISLFSDADRLRAIKMIIRIYKTQNGNQDALNDTLQSGLDIKRISFK